MRHLLVIDHYDPAAVTRGVAAAATGSEPVDVLLLGLSNDWFRWRHGATIQPAQWQLVEQAPFAAEAMRRVRAFVVEQIAALPDQDLGGTSLRELLAHPARDGAPAGSEWWFTETSEKGPYRGPFVGQCYRLAMLRLVVEQGNYASVACRIRDRELRSAVETTPVSERSRWTMLRCDTVLDRPPLTSRPLLRYWAQLARTVATCAAAKWLAAAVGQTNRARVDESVRSADTTFTIFPSWWFGGTTAAPRDRFFSPRTGLRPHAYLAWLEAPLALWRARRTVGGAMARHSMVPLQRFVRLRDLLAVCSLRRFLRVVRFERHLRSRIRAAFSGFDVSAMLGSDVSHSLSGAEPARDWLLTRAMARATVALQPRSVIYRAEFQPVEHAVLLGASASRTLTAGFVHFPFGEPYLSMRFARSEVASLAPMPVADAATARPMPDGLLAIGRSAARHAIDGGYPAERIAVCGPQRYGGLTSMRMAGPGKTELRARLGWPADRFVVFVAFAIVDSDTEALSAALARIGTQSAEVHLVLRTHPNQPRAQRAIGALIEAVGPSRASLMPADGGLYDYIRAADLLVCVGSMIAFEAMALGVMPVVFENPATYAATSLAEYEAGLCVVRGGAELAEAVEAVRINSEGMRRKAATWPEMVAEVLGDLEQPLGPQMDSAIETLRKGAGK